MNATLEGSLPPLTRVRSIVAEAIGRMRSDKDSVARLATATFSWLPGMKVVPGETVGATVHVPGSNERR